MSWLSDPFGLRARRERRAAEDERENRLAAFQVAKRRLSDRGIRVERIELAPKDAWIQWVAPDERWKWLLFKPAELAARSALLWRPPHGKYEVVGWQREYVDCGGEA